MIQISGDEIKSFFVEPVLQGSGIGEKLLNYVVGEAARLGCGRWRRTSGQSILPEAWLPLNG